MTGRQRIVRTTHHHGRTLHDAHTNNIATDTHKTAAAAAAAPVRLLVTTVAVPWVVARAGSVDFLHYPVVTQQARQMATRWRSADPIRGAALAHLPSPPTFVPRRCGPSSLDVSTSSPTAVPRFNITITPTATTTNAATILSTYIRGKASSHTYNIYYAYTMYTIYIHAHSDWPQFKTTPEFLIFLLW